jgi:hypothetical protein
MLGRPFPQGNCTFEYKGIVNCVNGCQQVVNH